MNKFFAFVASLLFTFIPFHTMRGESHLLINTIFAVPIFVLLAVVTFRTEAFFARSKDILARLTGRKRTIILCLLAIVASCCSSGGYFVFFGCYSLLILGVSASIDKKNWAPLLTALVIISICCCTFLISISPKFIAELKYGSNSEVYQRSPAQSEILSLKITQLLFPNNGHIIPALRNFKYKYNLTAPLINENSTATLGIVGAAGFLCLLLVLVIKKLQLANNNLFPLAIINISCLLMGVTGGFGAVFAYSVTHMMRGYNRISVFISFISLAAFFIVLQALLNKRFLNKNILTTFVLAVIILVIGLLDEIPQLSPGEDLSQKYAFDYFNDAKFISLIEKTVPPSTLVFQLPFVPYPGSGNINELTEYEHFRAYLHSHNTHWSYGAYKGTTLAKWQESVSKMPVNEMITQIGPLGFTGLYINRKGFPDRAVKLEQELQSITHVKPLINSDETIAFYDLGNFMQEMKTKHSSLWQNGIEKNNLLLINLSWIDGFYELENNSWRWSNKKSTLKIENSLSYNVPLKLGFRIEAEDQSSTILLTGDLINDKFKMNTHQDISKELVITPGIHYVNFVSNGKKIDAPQDPRQMFFRITNLLVKRLDSEKS